MTTPRKDNRLLNVRLNQIRQNPHRQLGDYPLDRRKVDALKRSIQQVGFWEGVIVRRAPDGDGYECAFGHHRLAAAREELGENKSVSVIVRVLDDGEMLQFMGRENAEDQRGNFLVMLETWEAAVRHLTNGASTPLPALKVASFLGWVTVVGNQRRKSGDEAQPTTTGYACHAVHRLIHSGAIDRDVFKGLSVADARNLAQTLIAEFDAVKTHADRKEKHAALVNAAKEEAYKIRASDRKLPGGALKASIRARAYKQNRIPELPSTLQAMSRQVDGWHRDSFESKLADICGVISEFLTDMGKDDIDLCRYLRKDLASAIHRCQDSIDRIDRALDAGAQAKLAAQTIPSSHWLGGQTNEVT